MSRRTGIERMFQNISREHLTNILQSAHIYDTVEVSRQEDIARLYEVLKFLPDDPEVSYLIPILIIRD
jgi:hypothetical protein